MRRLSQKIYRFFLALILTGCSGQKAIDFASTQNYSGYIVVTSVATDPATGPGTTALFTPTGQLSKIIYDYFANTEFPTGSGFIPPNKIITGIEGADRLELVDLIANSITPIINVGLTSTPLKQVAVDSAKSIWIVESTNFVEKFTLNENGTYSRAGNPFINTTVGSCSLTTPWGITYISSVNRIAVISSAAAGRLSIYETDGSCYQHITAAPFSTNTPQSIAYHALSNKLIVGFIGNHSIYSMNLDGTGATQIYLNSTIINTPRAIATDSAGYIYVSSSGTDTVEKLYYSGSGTATRALAGPLLGPGVTTQNPTSITVIP